MAQFSIDSDISPLKRRHFGSTSRNSLSSQDRGYLDRQFGKAESDQLDRNFDIAMKMDQKRNNDLRYEANLLALQTAKDKAARERDSYQQMPSFMGDLDNALNSDKSPYEKEQDLGKLTMKYSGLLASNKAAGFMFTGASNVVTSGIKGSEYEQRQADKDFAYASRFKDPETRRKLYMQDGVLDEREAMFEQDLEYAGQEDSKKLLIKQTEDTLKQAEGVNKTLISMKPELTAEEQRTNWMEQYKDTPRGQRPKQPSFTKTYSPTQIQILKSQPALLGITDEEIQSLSPAALHSKLITTSQKQVLEYRKSLGRVPTPTQRSQAGGLFK